MHFCLSSVTYLRLVFILSKMCVLGGTEMILIEDEPVEIDF